MSATVGVGRGGGVTQVLMQVLNPFIVSIRSRARAHIWQQQPVCDWACQIEESEIERETAGGEERVKETKKVRG